MDEHSQDILLKSHMGSGLHGNTANLDMRIDYLPLC